jgi:hypothetical protein
VRNNLREAVAREWEIWKRWIGGRHVDIETVHVRKGHLMLEHDGVLIDLGPCSLEDLRLIAFVAQEAYIRLPSKRGRSKSTPGTLAKVRTLTKGFWQASENPGNRVRRVPGRSVDAEALTGDGFPRA